jgi:hypothetical protein
MFTLVICRPEEESRGRIDHLHKLLVRKVIFLHHLFGQEDDDFNLSPDFQRPCWLSSHCPSTEACRELVQIVQSLQERLLLEGPLEQNPGAFFIYTNHYLAAMLPTMLTSSMMRNLVQASRFLTLPIGLVLLIAVVPHRRAAWTVELCCRTSSSLSRIASPKSNAATPSPDEKHRICS